MFLDKEYNFTSPLVILVCKIYHFEVISVTLSTKTSACAAFIDYYKCAKSLSNSVNAYIHREIFQFQIRN